MNLVLVKAAGVTALVYEVYEYSENRYSGKANLLYLVLSFFSLLLLLL